MEITFTVRHGEIPLPFKDRMEKKLSKLEPLLNHMKEAHVVVSYEGYRCQIEATLLADSITLHAFHESHDLAKSGDKVIEKLKSQIQKYRSKVIEQPRLTMAKGAETEEAPSEELLREEFLEEEPPEGEPLG